MPLKFPLFLVKLRNENEKDAEARKGAKIEKPLRSASFKTTESVRINKKIRSLGFRVFGSYSYNPCTIAGPKIMNTNEDRISTANATAIVLASRSAP